MTWATPAQGWLSVWSSLITIISVVFFAYVPHNGQAAAIDWTVPAFAVLLPLFGLVWWAFQRREGALRDLAQGALRVFWGGQPGSP